MTVPNQMLAFVAIVIVAGTILVTGLIELRHGSVAGVQLLPYRANDIALKASDVPGLIQCDGSGSMGDMIAYNRRTGARGTLSTLEPYAQMASAQGATSTWYGLYAQRQATCDALLNTDQATIATAPFVGNIVVVFHDPAQARMAWASGEFGPGPVTNPDLGHGRQVGAATGLGPSSATYTSGEVFSEASWASGAVYALVFSAHSYAAVKLAAAVDARTR